MTTLTCIDGENLSEDDIIAEAYTHVEAGYLRALSVKGLPDVERNDLQQCLIAAGSIAHKGRLHPVGDGA